jgi:exodeoxyribonuclease VII large subunit
MASQLDGDVRVWTIGDLNRRASLAVVKEFRGRVWIVGELTRVRGHAHRWLELVDRGGGREGRDAQLQAVCWATKWQRLERKLGDAGVELQPGQRLTVAGSLAIGDDGKLTFTIDDIDIDALVGDRLRERRKLVQRLVAADLFDANRRLVLPPLALRVGLVASAGSDGFHDVKRRLDHSGFAFDIVVRSVPVEGLAAPRAVKAALSTFGPEDVDVVVVVRGGGAKASLDVFDSAVVAHAIATAAVPVWTGIGHTGDRSVADEVAHRCFATPTALAQALVTAATESWAELEGAMSQIARRVGQRLDASAAEVDERRRRAVTLAGHQLALQEQRHARTSSDLRRAAGRSLGGSADQLTVAAHRIRASGTVELRDVRRRLAALAQDAAGAARRCCADAAADVAVTAGTLRAGTVQVLRVAGAPIDRAGTALTRSRAYAVLDAERSALAAASARVGHGAGRRLAADTDRSAGRRAVLEAYDPRRQLARGWTLTHTADGRLLRRATDVAEGDALVTTFAGGTARSTVTDITPADDDGPA